MTYISILLIHGARHRAHGTGDKRQELGVSRKVNLCFIPLRFTPYASLVVT